MVKKLKKDAKEKKDSPKVRELKHQSRKKRIKKYKSKLYLVPENDKYEPIEITKEMDFSIWGIVTYVIHPID